MIRVDFTVYGNTMTEIQRKANERLSALSPGSAWTKVNYYVEPSAVATTGEIFTWSARVEAVS